MTTYVRSVGLRLAGLLAGLALWIALIIWALGNFDTPISVPEQIRNIYPFLIVAVVAIGAVYLYLRRAGPGPGWWMFVIGVLAPFLAILVTQAAASGEFTWFWFVVAVVVLLPVPKPRRAD